ncbi:MAG: hypothetical protein AUJ12_03390 [Alphaproteobacteria bacterium CG1_02_46_17]|nr:MAG: hypothetical protein AUJ12_03390 [Alphaproteobacteria bacterium CG1_02_46_17]
MTLYYFPVSDSPENVARVFTKEPYTLWFDSARSGHAKNQFSYILFSPSQIFKNTSFEDQKKILFSLKQDDGEFLSPVPFCGGLAGYWGYDLVRKQENIHECHQQDKDDLPVCVLGMYNEFYAFDHLKEVAWYVCYSDSKQDADEKFLKFKCRLDQIQSYKSSNEQEGEIKFISDFSRKEYELSVQKIINHIFEGDIFQANMSRRYQAAKPDYFDPFLHYLKLRKENSAPYSAYMNMDSFHILSTSPESFLSVDKKGWVTTRPIKGTARNGDDLQKSEKDRAENIMIVDLLRNDLSKVCTDESVTVSSLCHSEEFEGLTHLVSVVEGQVKEENTSLDVLQAAFPGGSITGAPKIESMRIIEKLERGRRGIYCGALGWAGYDGAMETNIAIRTVICDDRNIWFNVGGGITISSDPALEFEETCLKAERILNSFNGGKHDCPDR